MIIIGVDYHPSFQQIAFADKDTGEYGERQVNHSEGEAEKFYRDLKVKAANVRVGMEATGHARCSSGCWRNWGSSYGLETLHRSRPSGYGSKRPTARTLGSC